MVITSFRILISWHSELFCCYFFLNYMAGFKLKDQLARCNVSQIRKTMASRPPILFIRGSNSSKSMTEIKKWYGVWFHDYFFLALSINEERERVGDLKNNGSWQPSKVIRFTMSTLIAFWFFTFFFECLGSRPHAAYSTFNIVPLLPYHFSF